MKGLSICFLLSFLWLNAVAFTCNPSTDCTQVGMTVPDPLDCEKYYLCISVNGNIVPSTNPLQCPEGQYFDQVVQSCNPEITTGICGLNICPIQLCPSKCPSLYTEITYAANPYDCSAFYICLSVGSVAQTCSAPNVYFNGIQCVNDPSQCCDFCAAYCTEAYTQIVDPCDCSSYYLCLGVGVPTGDMKMTCGSGNYYDETTATCKPGSCSSLCACSSKTKIFL